MPYGSGLGASLGVKAESAYGTYAAPDRFLSGFGNVKHEQTAVELTGVQAGRIAPLDEIVTDYGGTGRLEVDVLTTKFGLLLQHLFGTTVTPAQQAATAAYLQSHTWGDNFGKSLTMQVGIPNTAGTVLPYTGVGGKITQAEFSCGIGEYLKASFDLDFQKVVDTESLASPSYPTGQTGFPFTQMALKLGTYDSEAAVSGVKGVTLTIARPMDGERKYAGNLGLKSEPIPNGFVEVTGSVEVDVVTQADFLDRFVDHSSTSMVWEFVGATIASTYKNTIRFRLPKVYFSGDIPEVTGPEVQSVSVPFKAFYDSTNGLVSAQYMSTDTAV